ncbi:MAG: potassium/proton antiporter [Intestinibacillus sp.]
MVHLTTMSVVAALLLLCVASSKLLYRFGVPTLLIFLMLGMLFGSDGLGLIDFGDFALAREICSAVLIFIMFYGGFGTSWKAARPVAAPAILMSSLGTVITAVITGLLCHFVLHTSLLEGLLIGSVLGSTDAASVFSILRSRKLNLRGGLASLLEIESGSNDPFAYMMTITILTLMQSSGGAGTIVSTLLRQLLFGLLIGAALGLLVAYFMRRFRVEVDGLYSLFIMAIAILSYTLAERVGGNGYLSVYIAGILLGNSKMLHKRNLVHFFDGISWLSQIILFFAIGLLSFPSRFAHILVPGILIFLFLLLVARPIATALVLTPFRVPFRHQIFVSWVGLRGAASIVFAIYAVSEGVPLQFDIFHIVFIVALLSVGVQGSLLPPLARKINLVDDSAQVLKTFTDYQEEFGAKLLEFEITPDSKWAGKSIMEANIPEEILVVMIRRGMDTIVPKGSTVLQENDTLVLSSNDFSNLLQT